MENDEWWNEIATTFQQEFEIPVAVHYGTPVDEELQLLPEDLSDKTVIELGCGGGQGSVGLAKRGASVVGVDASEEQLSFADSLADEHGVNVDFRQDDVTKLDTVPSDTYDFAYSAYVFCWVDDIKAAFEQTRRVLRDDGVFVFSIPNPYYELIDEESLKVTGWYDRVQETAYDDGESGTLYHHRITDVFGALQGAGFTVTDFLEPQSSNPRDAEGYMHVDAAVMEHVPPTVVFRATPE